MKPHFLGIDGGQTSTLAVIVDSAGRLLGVGRAGPSNHIHEPGGLERLRRALHESLAIAWRNAGLPVQPGQLPELEAACCGMTGGGEQVAELLSQAAHIRHVRVEHDSVTAHAGALLGEPGVIVIAGTGSVAYGVNARGETARSGGWAYLMGDEGSAYDIGRQALVAAARMEDGRGPQTCLLEDILSYFGKRTLWEVRNLVYSPEFDRVRLASLAPLVSLAAVRGDQAAQSILNGAGKSLAELAATVLRRLGMEAENARVAPVGGVFKAGDIILSPFKHWLGQFAPHAALTFPALPPVLGAVFLALRAAGVKITAKVKRNLAESAVLLENRLQSVHTDLV